MDLHLKQWRNQHESEQQPPAKMPKLLFDPHHTHQQQEQHQQQHASGSALHLFVPEPNSKISNLSAFPDSTTRFPRMGSYFSMAQWQELELQALIYRYMLAGAAVPPELLQPIKKSLLPSPYFLHHPLQHYPHNYQPAALLQSGYWARAAMDPEPGRCRRTDGKKWRCSRDVVAGQKYCERHMHRGRNRSRKPVEMPTPNSTNNIAAAGGGGGVGCAALKAFPAVAAAPLAVVGNGPDFGLSGPTPSIDLLHLSHSSLEPKTEQKSLFEAQNEVGNRSDGHILRHFFDDWPRESDNAGSNASSISSATSLSMSMPGNSSSDVSLKLSTGNGDDLGAQQDSEREQLQLNWATGWASNQMAPMGGPLGEALRSSASNSSPTSVLHQLPRVSMSETSYVGA